MDEQSAFIFEQYDRDGDGALGLAEFGLLTQHTEGGAELDQAGMDGLANACGFDATSGPTLEQIQSIYSSGGRAACDGL